MKCYSCGNLEYSFDQDLDDVVTIDPGTGLCSACLRRKVEEGDDSAFTEYYTDKFIWIGEKQYPSIRLSGNIHPCSECKRPIFGVPLLLWGDNGHTMVAFCSECAEKILPCLESQKGEKL